MNPHKSYLRHNYYYNAHGVINIILLSALLLCPFAGAQTPPPDESTTNTNMNFNPSVGVIVIVLVAVLFFMVFVSIYILHCNESGNVGESIRRIAGASRRGRPCGLDPDVIATFPTFVYSSVKGLKIGKGALECAVCLSEFEDDETLRLIPKCDHVFHHECIDEWLAAHTTCPVCRANLVPQPDESIHVPVGLVVDRETDAQTSVVDHDQNGQNDNSNNNNDYDTINDSTEDKAEDSVKRDKEILMEVGGSVGRSLNRSRTRGSRRARRFPRSHSTGHSLVQPGENIERFTLRLPDDVRKQLMNRASSMRVPCPSVEESSRKGYRFGGEGSSRGGKSWKRLDRMVMSDRWVFNRMPSFFQRISSIRSPRGEVVGETREESSHTPRLPV